MFDVKTNSPKSPPPKPLEGIRVLDISRILAGPSAAQMLSDLGAEVIKIERPVDGDDTRSWGPPFIKAEPKEDNRGEAAYFMSANRGKKSIAVDLKSKQGQAIVGALAEKSDVIIENFKVGDLVRYGLDAKSMQAKNPKLIYCSITGFGQDGPRAHQAGYDLMIQGMAGLMSITGNPDDTTGGEPMKVGVAMVDVLTSLNAVIGVVSALYEREKTGVGRQLDLALFDVCVASLANQCMNYLLGGQIPQRMGNLHPNIAPYQTYQVADGYMILAVGNDQQFTKFCGVAGLEDLVTDDRFATNSARIANRDVLNDILMPVLQNKDRDYWIKELDSVGVPCGPINGLDDVFADPHAVAKGLVQNLPHKTLGDVATVANPIRMDGEPVSSERAAPVLGEHSTEILQDILGLSEGETKTLMADRIVQQFDEKS